MNPLLVSTAFVTGAALAGAEELPRYMGQAVCQECHRADGDGGACAIPHVPEHEKAVSVLARPEAEEIAAVSGVPREPQGNPICLGCHATGAEEGPRWHAESFDVTAGVQCEACHGAGSLHVAAHESQVHGGDQAAGKIDMRAVPHPSSFSGFAALSSEKLEGWGTHAEKLEGWGTHTDVQAWGGALRPVDRWVCGTCHRQRPSHRLVLEEGFRRSPADRLYKTPVNLAVSPDGARVYVACTQSNSVIVLDAARHAVLAEIRVGSRPQEIAVSPDGERLYVTNRLDDTVSVIDTSGYKVVAEIPVGDEPHGVVTDAGGRHVFVANTDEDTISVIDAAARVELRRLSAGRGPWSMALAPDGRSVYATSVRPNMPPFREPHQSEVTVVDAGEGTVINRSMVADANMLKGIDVVAAGPHRGVVFFVLMRSKNLVPATRLVQGWVITNGLGVIWPDGRVDQVLLDQPSAYFPDPNDVAISPDGRHALVTSGGSDRVAVVEVGALLETLAGFSDLARQELVPNHLGLSSRFVLKQIEVGSNPRGIMFSADGRRAYVANALDDSVSVIDAADFSVAGRLGLGGPAEVTELRRGEMVFHSAGITFGGQFSCQSCHPDGHINGLTMDIEADGVGLKPVDNRTLRGILDTGPFKWEGTNPSLSRQCGPRLAVFFTRLAPYTPDELRALVRYMCTIERPPNRYRPDGGLTPAQYRGKLVFERAVNSRGERMSPEQRCITCHNGPYRTAQTRAVVRTTMWFDTWVNIPLSADNVFNAENFGPLGLFYFADTGVPAERLDAPHLNNIYDSAPYMHNGASETLEEMWTRFNMLEGHGLAGDLTREQFNDLMAYLRTL